MATSTAGPRSRRRRRSSTARTGPRSSSPTTSRASTVSAPNRVAWATARWVRSAPGDPLGEAEVVLDGGALAGLPAGCVALDHDGAQPLGRARTRRRPARPARCRRCTGRRAAARARGAQPERVGELDASSGSAAGRRRAAARAAGRRASPRRGSTSARRLVVALEVEPGVRHVVAGEEHLDVVAAVGPQVADDPHAGRCCRGGRRARRRAGRRPPGRAAASGWLPRLEHVVVEPDVVDRLDGDVGVGVGGEQQQLGVGRVLA